MNECLRYFHRQTGVESSGSVLVPEQSLASSETKSGVEEDEGNRTKPRKTRIQIWIFIFSLFLFVAMSMEVTTSWDALRKQARKLEAQLDEQMNLYRKLVSTKVSVKVDAAENDVESVIERLLKQLQLVNSQMQAWVSSGGSEMVSHTLTRHQEILQDLTQEFYRLRASLKAKQDHASLLDDFREFDRSRLDLEDGVDSAEQGLLREHASISRNTGHMDSVISQAQATLGSLVLQRSTFSGINSKLSNVGSRLPTVNHILSAIRKKKSMDAIILSLVASVCTFLIFIYWLSK